MPRGNDAEAAGRELQDKYGPVAGNAEDVIQAARDRYPQELREALLANVDTEASADLDWAEVAAAADIEEDSLHSAHVRGGRFVVFAYETAEDGRVHKDAIAYTDGQPQKLEEGGSSRKDKEAAAKKTATEKRQERESSEKARLRAEAEKAKAKS